MSATSNLRAKEAHAEYSFIPASAYVQAPPREAVAGILPSGLTVATLRAVQPERLMLGMLADVVTGQPCWGRPTGQGEALYVVDEYPYLGADIEAAGARPDGLYIDHADDGALVERCAAFLDTFHDARLIVIQRDTLPTGAILAALRAMARAHDVAAVVAVTGEVKVKPFDVDAVLLFREESAARRATVTVDGRHVRATIALAWDEGTNRWSPREEAAPMKGAAVAKPDGEARILDILRDEGRPMRPAEVAARLGENRNTVTQRMGRMHKAGKLVKAGDGKYEPTAGDIEAVTPDDDTGAVTQTVTHAPVTATVTRVVTRSVTSDGVILVDWPAKARTEAPARIEPQRPGLFDPDAPCDDPEHRAVWTWAAGRKEWLCQPCEDETQRREGLESALAGAEATLYANLDIYGKKRLEFANIPAREWDAPLHEHIEITLARLRGDIDNAAYEAAMAECDRRSNELCERMYSADIEELMETFRRQVADDAERERERQEKATKRSPRNRGYGDEEGYSY